MNRRAAGPPPVVVRACRVLPDLPAVPRAFDYGVPERHAAAVAVGTIVRVPLHGRRVRGWVVDDDLDAPEVPPGELLALHDVVSAGPPPEVVALTAWAAWRWAGPRALLLRTASAPSLVAPSLVAPSLVAPSPIPPTVAPSPVPPSAPAGNPAPPPRPSAAAGSWPDRAAGPTPGATPGGDVTVTEVPPTDDDVDVVADLVLRAGGGGSVLVVLGPGRRARALTRRLTEAGLAVVESRSDQPDAVRTRAWRAARRGGCVVLGGRAVAWAPVPDLVLAVVVDEGDEGLKEERAPTWHARDVLVERARRCGARLALRSPLPSAEAERLATVQRPTRARARAGWPLVEVVDRRAEPPGGGLVAPRTVDLLRAAVGAGERAVCVLNRRGRARLLACLACGAPARCDRCGRAVHLVDLPPPAGAGAGAPPARALRCPACTAGRPPLCLECGATRLRVVRPGIAHVADDLAGLVPGAGVGEVDAASARVPAVPLLVGTEAVLHRVGAAGVVVLLDADRELLAPRSRAEERAMWLLVRAARLVGPRDGGRRVVVQTRVPDHPVLDAAVRADPGRWRSSDRDRRALLGLPPHRALAELVGEPAAVVAAGEALAAAGVEVLGPVDAPGGGQRSLVRAPSHGPLCDALAGAVPPARALGRLRVEVDPDV